MPNPKHQCKALLAIIFIHTHCIRHVQVKVSRFIQETCIFQKRKTFNVSDSCLMALKAWLNGCLLPLQDPHTPINTRASGTLQRTKKHTTGERKKHWREAAHKIHQRLPEFSKQSHPSAKVAKPRSPDRRCLHPGSAQIEGPIYW